MQTGLSDKVIVVTGAASSIGRAFARLAAAAGAVSLVAVRPPGRMREAVGVATRL